MSYRSRLSLSYNQPQQHVSRCQLCSHKETNTGFKCSEDVDDTFDMATHLKKLKTLKGSSEKCSTADMPIHEMDNTMIRNEKKNVGYSFL